MKIDDLKKYKYTAIAIIVFFLLIVLGFVVYNIFFPNAGKPIYGNRLEGIESVKITDEALKEVSKKLEENSIVASCKASLSGRTAQFIVNVKKGTKVEDAKKLAKKISDNFTKEQRAYFDFQVFLVTDEKTKGYPIIGYMIKGKNDYSFTQGS